MHIQGAFPNVKASDIQKIYKLTLGILQSMLRSVCKKSHKLVNQHCVNFFFVSINEYSRELLWHCTFYQVLLYLYFKTGAQNESFDALSFIALFTTTFVRAKQNLVRNSASYSGDRWLKSD
jgi:hypothetical protein